MRMINYDTVPLVSAIEAPWNPTLEASETVKRHTPTVGGRKARAVRLPRLLVDSIAETCLEQLLELFRGEPAYIYKVNQLEYRRRFNDCSLYSLYPVAHLLRGRSGPVHRWGRGDGSQQPRLGRAGELLIGVLPKVHAGTETGFDPERDPGKGWRRRRTSRGSSPQGERDR